MRHYFFISVFIFIFFTTKAQQPINLSSEKIDSLVDYYIAQEDYYAALPYAKLAFSLNKGQDEKQVNVLYAIYSIYYNLEDYDQAEYYILQLVDLSLKLYGPKSKKYHSYLEELAANSHYQGKFQQSELLFNQVIAFFEQNKDDYDRLLESKIHLADLYLQIGKYHEAEVIYLEEKDRQEKAFGKKSEAYGKALANLAIVYFYMEHYTASEAFFKEYAAIFKVIFGDKHHRYASAIDNLASFYLGREQYKKAEPLLLEAADIQLKEFGKESSDYVYCLEHLGQLYSDLNQFEKAEKIFIEDIKLCAKVWGKDHEFYGIAHACLAGLYVKMKKNEAAISLYEKAIVILENSIGKANHDYALYHNNLSNIYVDLNDLDKAQNTLLTGIQANTNTPSFSFPLTPETTEQLFSCRFNSFEQMMTSFNLYYKSQYNLYLQTGKQSYLEEAYRTAKLSIDLTNKSRAKFNADEDELFQLERSNLWVEKALNLYFKRTTKQPHLFTEAFQMAELHKSALLHKAIKTQEAYSFGNLPDSLVEKEQLLQKKMSETQAAFDNSADPTTQALKQEALNSVLGEVTQFKKYLKEKFPQYSNFKYEQKNIELEQLQKQLEPNSMMLEYVLSDSAIYVFSVTKDQAILHNLPVTTTALTPKIKSLRKALSDYAFIQKEPTAAFKLYNESAYWFYQELLAPLLTNKNINSLIIVADGELGHLPFEAFLTNFVQTETAYQHFPYLLNQYKISYNYSATLWLENKSENQPKKTNNNLLLAFAANYQKDSTPPTHRAPHLNKLRNALIDLPAAKTEVEGLSKLFDGEFLYGKEASEKAFKEKAGKYAIIHLAMHGILNKQYPVLSSLAFSEDRDSIEDNFLLAYEISHLQLEAQLVVLSACETGYGKFQQGEGVLSLARSFMYAGVPSLVVSLWQVNDGSTAVIMAQFYNNLAKGMDKALALQQAKLDYIKMTGGIAAHPAFWSPFIQLGNTDAIYLEKKGGYRGYLVLFVFVGGLFFLKNRKKQNA